MILIMIRGKKIYNMKTAYFPILFNSCVSMIFNYYTCQPMRLTFSYGFQPVYQ